MTEFSKKTGDYPSLSAADLQVLALTCQLQAEIAGPGCVRWEPQDKVGRAGARGAGPGAGPSAHGPRCPPGAAQLHPAAPRGSPAPRRLPPAQGKARGRARAAAARSPG